MDNFLTKYLTTFLTIFLDDFDLDGFQSCFNLESFRIGVPLILFVFWKMLIQCKNVKKVLEYGEADMFENF